MTPSENRKSMTVLWLELSSKIGHLSSKPLNVSQILSAKSNLQDCEIAVIILKNSLPHKKTFLHCGKKPF